MNDQKEKAYLAMVERYNTVIYKTCYVYARDEAHLCDLYQEVAANLWRGFDGYRGESQLSTWVYRVSINTCISDYRRERKHRFNVKLTNDLPLPAVGGQRTQHLQQMYALINQLDDLEKALILLWLDEKKYDEIAEITGVSRNNVASKLRRTKEKLVRMSNL